MAGKNEQIGPQLPPHLRKQVEENNCVNINETDKDCSVGFELASCGDPTSHKGDQNLAPFSVNCDDQHEMFGPRLPPGLEKRASDVSIGPALPPEWQRTTHDDNEEEDDSVIGPLPNSSGNIDDDANLKYEIESRARAMRDRLEGKARETAPKREAWMTELPPELGANIGIVARTFKKRTLNSSESDRSVWTDTPQDRERKSRDQLMKKSVAEHAVEPVERQRDLEMKKKVEEHNTQYRSTSLMEMHQEERKKKKGEGPIERRPFDRSTDLDLKKTDRKAASTFIKGAKGMNSKFENAKFESKYL